MLLFAAQCSAQSTDPVCFGRMRLHRYIFTPGISDRDRSRSRLQHRTELLHPGHQPGEPRWCGDCLVAGDTLCQGREPTHSADRPHSRTPAKHHAMSCLDFWCPNPVIFMRANRGQPGGTVGYTANRSASAADAVGSRNLQGPRWPAASTSGEDFLLMLMC